MSGIRLSLAVHLLLAAIAVCAIVLFWPRPLPDDPFTASNPEEEAKPPSVELESIAGVPFDVTLQEIAEEFETVVHMVHTNPEFLTRLEKGSQKARELANYLRTTKDGAQKILKTTMKLLEEDEALGKEVDRAFQAAAPELIKFMALLRGDIVMAFGDEMTESELETCRVLLRLMKGPAFVDAIAAIYRARNLSELVAADESIRALLANESEADRTAVGPLIQLISDRKLVSLLEQSLTPEDKDRKK